jgi:hypothetical protein
LRDALSFSSVTDSCGLLSSTSGGVSLCANAHPPCSDPYFLRLRYSLPFTSVVGEHVLIVDLDEQQRVVNKGEMTPP